MRGFSVDFFAALVLGLAFPALAQFDYFTSLLGAATPGASYLTRTIRLVWT